MTTTIYVVRHGQAEHNAAGVYGGLDDTALTKEGIVDAEVVASKLKSIHFDTVYSSNLQRASMTAGIIISHSGFIGKIVEIKELREIDFGNYSGRDRKLPYTDFPDEFKKKLDFVIPGGESYRQLWDRVIPFLKSILCQDGTILISCHGGPIRAIKSYFKNLPFEEHLKDKIPHKMVYKFVIEDGVCVEHEEF